MQLLYLYSSCICLYLEKIMRKTITLILFSILIPVMALAQNNVKRVAILETVDKAGTVSYGTKLLLRQSITYAITQTPGYEGYNRVDIAQMLGEHEFQRTGYVSDSQIKKLGKMTGAAYVLIAEAANYDAEHIVILANLVNVETGQIENSSVPVVAGTDPENMAKSCAYLAEILLNRKSAATYPSSHSSPKQASRQASNTIFPANSVKNYIESAMDIGMTMVWVDGGEFKMGCTSEQSDCREDEMNIKKMKVDGFYIGMLEVTQAQWRVVMGTSVSSQKEKTNYRSLYGEGDEYPIYYVNWDEANEFCKKLSLQTGRKYTLPTEAQWEYAARGGNIGEITKYAGSNNADEVAWYSKNSYHTHPCGEKEANVLGIYDMSGNVSEWCKDNYTDSSLRVHRGGSFEDGARSCRVSNRNGERPNTRSYNTGFRVVCIP